MTTTSAALVPMVDRCCVCDRTTVVTHCAACHEPVCLADLRVVGDVGERQYYCAVCHLDQKAELEASRANTAGSAR